MSQQLICSACGHVGSTKRSVKGSLGVEIFLWLCFFIPGIIYSLWRQSTYHKACAVCGGTNLIPVNSPVGQKLLKEQGVSTDTGEVGVVSNESSEKYSTKKKILIFWAIMIFGVLPLILSLIID